MKEEIKELRVKIDGLAQLVKSLNPDRSSVIWRAFFTKETEKTYDSLILAKAWLGKVLGELGEPTPYSKDGQRKTVEDIEPTADTAKAVPGLREPFTGKNARESMFNLDTWELNGRSMMDWDNFNHVERVDWLREEIKLLIDQVGNLQINFENFDLIKSYSVQITSITNTFNHLSEARFWLGFELQRIRENDKQKSILLD